MFPAGAVLVADLPLGARSAYACREAGIITVRQLRKIGPIGLFELLPDVGRKVLRDIEEAIGTWELLPDPPHEWIWIGNVPTSVLVAELARRFPVTP